LGEGERASKASETATSTAKPTLFYSIRVRAFFARRRISNLHMDSWLFGEDLKKKGGVSVSVDEETIELDLEPPVLFTLGMGDLRQFVQIMYMYQNAMLHFDSSYNQVIKSKIGFDPENDISNTLLNTTNKLWPYMPVVVDAYVDGEDGARIQIQKMAQLALENQLASHTSCVQRMSSGIFFTHTPSDVWESLNAHAEISGIGENSNER